MPDRQRASHVEEQRLLLGPQDRSSEFWRVLRIAWEFMRGFRKLHFVGPCVTVFGSAKFAQGHPYYEAAQEMGRLLGREGFTVMTGGGPGLMEAANRGAKEVGGRSIGCNIELSFPQAPNNYLDDLITFRYFFVRKVMLVKYSYAFVVFPGGFGTLDEIFEALTLIQTEKIRDFPVILIGSDFWSPLVQFMHDRLVAQQTISEPDFRLLHLMDSPAEALEALRDMAIRRFGLTYGPRMKRRRFLFE